MERFRRAFTLIEAIMALALMVLILQVSSFTVRQVSQQFEEQVFILQLRNEFHAAHTRAIATGRWVRFDALGGTANRVRFSYDGQESWNRSIPIPKTLRLASTVDRTFSKDTGALNGELPKLVFNGQNCTYTFVFQIGGQFYVEVKSS